jgi:hypothetical protein
MIEPWRAACVQMRSEIAQAGADRDAAWEIIGRNLARAVELPSIAAAALANLEQQGIVAAEPVPADRTA